MPPVSALSGLRAFFTSGQSGLAFSFALHEAQHAPMPPKNPGAGAATGATTVVLAGAAPLTETVVCAHN